MKLMVVCSVQDSNYFPCSINNAKAHCEQEYGEKCLNNPTNRERAALERGAVHIKRHGIKGSIVTYFVIRKWARR